MDLKDVRIDGYRTAVAHWTGTYKVHHLPTGLFIQYGCDWRNHRRLREAALKELAKRVENPMAYPAVG